LEEKLTYTKMRNFLLNLSDRILQSKDDLNGMDAECGDGDFGTSMFVAFTNLQKITQANQTNDVGKLLTDAGQAILATAGGAAGPIFGTLFTAAGKAVKGKNELGVSDLAGMFEAALLKIEARGGARVGDKTLIDALEPAVLSLKKSSADNTPLPSALRNAANAARTASEGTKDLVARQGKARYLAEQTLGHLDPGAYVTALLFEHLYAEAK
jgi:dihydroxyacetone kinase phosphoprotein-dependent L subunit